MNQLGKIIFSPVFALLLASGCQTTQEARESSVDTPVAASSSSDARSSDMSVGAPGNVIFADPAELEYKVVREDYRIGPYDLLDIIVFRAPELSAEVRVDDQGYIKLPMLGNVNASGLTHNELADRLADKMRVNLLQNPQVTVSIKEFSSMRVTVQGEVKRAGVYPIKGQMTLLQAIATAEGLTNLASSSKVILFRQAEGNRVKAYPLNLSDIQDGRVGDPYLKNEDRIIVHRAEARYWVREAAQLITPWVIFY
jgi:polysaccharide export outer membrane protein